VGNRKCAASGEGFASRFIWQFQFIYLRFAYAPRIKFGVPVALGNIVRSRDVVLICPHWLRASPFR
jgi:hypothetical protein